jgi:exodeoxyribonuclease VII small subunit
MSEPQEPLTFEQALERIEQIVRSLETNDIGLDQSLVRYEEGVQLLKRCLAMLDEAERKIRLLTGLDAAGNPITRPFDGTPTAQREAAPAAEPAVRGERNTVKNSRRPGAEPAREEDRLFE